MATRSGRDFIAVRDNEIAAKVFGVSIFRTKLLAFGVSSFIIGVAGFLWAFAYLRTVEPDGFNLDRSFSILFIIIIGGLASIRGAFFGAALMVVFPLALSRLGALLFGGVFDTGVLDMSQRIVIGVLIILFLIAEPSGLVALCDRLTKRLSSGADTAAFTSGPEREAIDDHRHTNKDIGDSCRAVAGGHSAPPSARCGAARADEQYFPLQSYRVGPYAAGGTGFFGGFIDYLNLINIRDGGVNGVKLSWDECETQYEVERGVECYERQKSHANIAAWNPLSVGIAYAMIDRITADKTPLITVNHGRTDFDRRPGISLRLSALA